MTHLLETDIERACIDYLTRMGCTCTQTHAGKHHPVKRGTWDVVGCLPDGRYFAMEFKRDKEKLSPDQVDWESDLTPKAMRLIARSLEQVMAWLAAVREGR